MSKLQDAPRAYSFDDFFLAPVHSEIKSRKDPDLSVSLNNFSYRLPIVSSPMNTVTGEEMLAVMNSVGGTSVLHRYLSIPEQCKIAERHLGFAAADFWVAVGVNGDAAERIDELWRTGVRSFCIDVANGHSTHCINAVKNIRQKYPEARIMAGNVCTYDGAYRLAEAGANAIRAGVGGGSMCTTRMVTGHGVPQLTAIEDCVKIKEPQEYHLGYGDRGTNYYYHKEGFPDVAVIADGGIRSSGDIVKCLAIGADAVMLGGLLAGTSATPGETHKDQNGMLYKYYHGMASEAGRASWFDREKTSFVPEGESMRVPYKGDTAKIILDIAGGVRSGMSYSGASNLEELRKKATWCRVTSSGVQEAQPHGKL